MDVLKQSWEFLKNNKKLTGLAAVVLVVVILTDLKRWIEAVQWLKAQINAVILSAAVPGPTPQTIGIQPWLSNLIVISLLFGAILLVSFIMIVGRERNERQGLDGKVLDLNGQVQAEKARIEELRAQIGRLEKEREEALTGQIRQGVVIRKTIERMMLTAFKLTQQVAPPGPRRNIHEIENSYLIGTNYDGEVHRRFVVEALEPLHFWEIRIGVEPEAEPQEFLDDIQLKIRDENGDPVYYLPTENGPRYKVVALFFLPPLQAGGRKTINISYRWSGLFRQMEVKGFERAEWNLTKESSNIISKVQYSFYVDRALGKIVCGEVYGWNGGIQVIRQATHPSYGWQGITYEITNATPGTYVLRVDLRNAGKP